MRTNAVVILHAGEDAEHAVKRLTRVMAKNGTLSALKRKAHYTKPGDAKRMKSIRARKAARKRQSRWVDYSPHASRDANSEN